MFSMWLTNAALTQPGTRRAPRSGKDLSQQGESADRGSRPTAKAGPVTQNPYLGF